MPDVATMPREAAVTDEQLAMPLGEFLKQLVIGCVDPHTMTRLETIIAAGRVARWNRLDHAGKLPPVLVGPISDLDKVV